MHPLLSAEYLRIKDLSTFYESMPGQLGQQALGSVEAALPPVNPMAAFWDTTQNLGTDFYLTESLGLYSLSYAHYRLF